MKKLLLIVIGMTLLSTGQLYADSCTDGNCRNGQGTYTWTNGAKYIGQFENGNMHGHGMEIYSNGAKYVGQFKNGKKHYEYEEKK